MIRKTITLIAFLVLAWPPGNLGAGAPDTLVILRQLEANNYDPHRTISQAGTEALFMMTDSLVALAEDLRTVVPGLAKSWEVSRDGKTYTFHLRDDVTFHSGRKMTAEDVVYSFNRCLGRIDPRIKSPVAASRLGDVREVRARDTYTVEVELNSPYNEFLQQITLIVGLIVDREAVEKLGPDFGVQGFGGTGPYMWVGWHPQGDLVLKRNPDYKWGPPIYGNRGPAKIGTVIWRTVPEESTLVAAMSAAQADLTPYVPKWAIKRLKAAPHLRLFSPKAYFWTVYTGFKINKPVVSDVRVRQAMVMAVDARAIVENIYFGGVRTPYAYFDQGARDFDPEILKIFPKYDPKGAAKLLDEAGWRMGQDGLRHKDGQKLSLLFYGPPSYAKPIEAIQGFLRPLGVEMRVQLFPGPVMWAKLTTQEYDAFGLALPYLSIGEALDSHFRSTNVPAPNRMNWIDPETDALLDQAKSALTEAERFAAYSKVQRKIHRAHVWLPVDFDDMYIAAHQRVKGVKPHSISGCGLYKGLDLELVR